MSEAEAIARWLATARVGASSRAIAAHMLGEQSDGSYPHDAGDFGRCESLLDAVPSLRARLPEMASVSRYWAALVPAWERIRTAEDRTAAIRAIVWPIQDRDFVRRGAT